MIYLLVAVWFGLATGLIGRISGSSFFIWFIVGSVVPVIGLFVALAYRNERDEVRASVPDLRQDRQAPRRDVHALRDRSRLPRGRDRAGIGRRGAPINSVSPFPSRREGADEPMMRAVDAIMECLKAEGVDVVFGYPGGANLPDL